MKEPSPENKEREDLRQKVIGLGEKSYRKNYYSDLKHSRQELQRFRAVLENIPDIIIVLNGNGRILDLNTTAEHFLKKPREELLGNPIEDQTGIDFPHLDSHSSERIITEEVLTDKEGMEKVISRMMYFKKVTLENEDFYVIVGRDVSLLISTENDLKTLNQSLEQKVQERTRELTNNLEELKATQNQLLLSEKMALLGELVAGVAHEINTPIGIGVTVSSALWSKVEKLETEYRNEELTEEDLLSFMKYLKESTALILVNLQRASDLIQSFKRVAVDQGAEDSRYILFKSYLMDVIRSLKPKCKHHHVVVKGDEKLEIETIPGIWSQIISNLLLNSIRHGFKDSLVSGNVEITFIRDKDVLELLYRDDGPGIPSDIMDRIYEPFFTTLRHNGGSGLGLHIVYNLVTMNLRGEIQYIPSAKGGACFKIRVPLTGDHSGLVEHSL